MKSIFKGVKTMKIFKEIKKIAQLNDKKHRLIELIKEKYGDMADGVYWDTAHFETLNKEDVQEFRKSGNETEDYFVTQSTGYLGDDFYGHLWFKTDVPGQYVKVYFEC